MKVLHFLSLLAGFCSGEKRQSFPPAEPVIPAVDPQNYELLDQGWIADGYFNVVNNNSASAAPMSGGTLLTGLVLDEMLTQCDIFLASAQQTYDSAPGTVGSLIFVQTGDGFPMDLPYICYNTYTMTDVTTSPSSTSSCRYVDNSVEGYPVEDGYIYTGFAAPTWTPPPNGKFGIVPQVTLSTETSCMDTLVADDPESSLTGNEIYVLKTWAVNSGVGFCFWYKIDPVANPNERPMMCSGYISRSFDVERLPDVSAKAPSGNCVRRCGTIGWGRTFGYKAEEEVAESVSENDKYFMAPVGFNQGWNMMPAMGMGFGFPPITPWGRPMPPPPPFFGWGNPFYMAPLGPPTPGFYAPPANQQEANNNRCMSALAGGCRCSCDDACTDNGDCCSDHSDQCAVVEVV